MAIAMADITAALITAAVNMAADITVDGTRMVDIPITPGAARMGTGDGAAERS